MYPEILWSSEEFGQGLLICSPGMYKEVIRESIREGFSIFFNPIPQEWTLVDSETGLYTTTKCFLADGKNHSKEVQIRIIPIGQAGFYEFNWETFK